MNFEVPAGVNPPVAQRPDRGFSSSEQDGAYNGNVYTELERKLVEQLRNAIAHLDLAEAEQRMRAEDVGHFFHMNNCVTVFEDWWRASAFL